MHEGVMEAPVGRPIGETDSQGLHDAHARGAGAIVVNQLTGCRSQMADRRRIPVARVNLHQLGDVSFETPSGRHGVGPSQRMKYACVGEHPLRVGAAAFEYVHPERFDIPKFERHYPLQHPAATIVARPIEQRADGCGNRGKDVFGQRRCEDRRCDCGIIGPTASEAHSDQTVDKL